MWAPIFESGPQAPEKPARIFDDPGPELKGGLAAVETIDRYDWHFAEPQAGRAMKGLFNKLVHNVH